MGGGADVSGLPAVDVPYFLSGSHHGFSNPVFSAELPVNAGCQTMSQQATNRRLKKRHSHDK